MTRLGSESSQVSACNHELMHTTTEVRGAGVTGTLAMPGPRPRPGNGRPERLRGRVPSWWTPRPPSSHPSGGDKAGIGDLGYDSATPRAEVAVDQWLRTHPPQQPGGLTNMPTDISHEFVDLDDYTHAIDDPAVDAVVARMWDDIHLHRMGLASVREALGFTQTDLAAELGVTQSNVAQTERRKDILVSTLARYLGAIGADLHLVVRFEGRPPVELSLDELSKA